MAWTRTRTGTRRALAVLAAGVGVGLALSFAQPGLADDYDDAVAQRDDSQSKVDSLKNELEGLSADLAQVYVDMESLKQQIPGAEADLAEKQEAAAVADRQHQVVQDQLVAAKDEQTRLESEIERTEKEAESAKAAVGEITRNMYRGESTPVLAVALTGQGTDEIGQRAAAADAASRIQTRALEDATANEALTRNQAERQSAVTDRIAKLEAEAKKTKDAADEAKDAAAAKVTELADLKAKAEENSKAWEARKGEAQAQLDAEEARLEEAAAKVAKINEENRASAISYTPASSSGAFGYPFSANQVITSSFGYRFHPIFGYEKLHTGTDFGAACGVPVLSIANGVVESAYFDSGGGNLVSINHGMVDGASVVSESMHLEAMNVGAGQSVSRGDVIGWVGTTGNSTGCHLHLSVYQNGGLVDPMGLF